MRAAAAAGASALAWLALLQGGASRGGATLLRAFVSLFVLPPLLGVLAALPGLRGRDVAVAGVAAAFAGPLITMVTNWDNMSYDNNTAVVALGTVVWLAVGGGIGSLTSWATGAAIDGLRTPTGPPSPSR
ncbi:MAG: hypothetical protein IT302_10150 [Dehalococcoidia bacterium]|nr:hypothetical protein [Dehalococcoidia bacterium]